MAVQGTEYWKYKNADGVQSYQTQTPAVQEETTAGTVDTSGTVYGEQGEVEGSTQASTEELVSEEEAVVGGQLDINPFSMVDDSAIKAEYMSLDTDNDGVLTKKELLSWDGIVEGISGTLDNLKEVFTGLGLKVSDTSGSSGTTPSTEGDVSADASATTEQPATEATTEAPVEGADAANTEQPDVTGEEVTSDGAETSEDEEILPDAVMIEGLKDATKEDFREIAKQSEEFWSEVEDIGLDKVFSLIDKDEDGKVSEEELKEIAELDSEDNEEAKNSISIDDLKKAIENDKAVKEAEAKAAEAEAQKGSDESDTKVNNTQSPRTNASSGAGGAGGSSGVGGSSGSYGGGSTSQANQPTGLDAMSIEELEAEKTSREGILNEKREELNGVYSGDNAAVQAAEDDMEAAKEAYDKLIEEDDNIPDELKEEKQQIEEDMTANQQEIDETKVSINDTEAEITDLNTQKTSVDSELSSLNASLSALPAKGDNAEKNAEIDEKKASIEQQIKEKESQKQEIEADIEAAEKELDELNKTLSTLEEEKAKLEEAKQQNQEAILDAASPEKKEALKEAMTKYNEAQAKVEETKESEASRIQGEIDTAQADVEEVSQKLTEKKNVETARENSVGGDMQAVIDWARQYDDMSQSQMSAIFAELGYQFDQGAWCADFVRMALGEAIGDENLPEWYQNVENKAYCPSIAAAGEGHQVDVSQAQPGDIVLFDWDSDGTPDHVGLLVDNGDGATTINTIEGNTSGAGGGSCVEEKPRDMSTVYGIYSMAS